MQSWCVKNHALIYHVDMAHTERSHVGTTHPQAQERPHYLIDFAHLLLDIARSHGINTLLCTGPSPSPPSPRTAGTYCVAVVVPLEQHGFVFWGPSKPCIINGGNMCRYQTSERDDNKTPAGVRIVGYWSIKNMTTKQNDSTEPSCMLLTSSCTYACAKVTASLWRWLILRTQLPVTA